MATKKDITSSYTEVAADITAVSLIQAPVYLHNQGYVVELVAASSAPAAGTPGVVLQGGETITSGNLTDLGSSGALYARVVGQGSNSAGYVIIV